MMARGHVLLGVGVYSTTSVVVFPDWTGSQPVPLLLGSLVVGAGALVPDLDHPNGTLTKNLGVVGKVLHTVIDGTMGGHRKGMHSLLFGLAMGVIFYLANFSVTTAAVLVGLSTLLIARFILPLRMGYSQGFVYVLIAALVALAFNTPNVMDGYWLPVAAAAGPLLHDLGDMLTKGKVHFLWPISKRTVNTGPLAFPTGGFFETRILTFVLLVWAFGMLAVYSIQPIMQSVLDSGVSLASSIG